MEIEKKNVYVRLDPEDTLDSKKDFLKITESLIKMMMVSRDFKALLDKESMFIEKWTKEAEKVSGEVGELTTTLPKEEREREAREDIRKIKGKEKAPEKLSEDEKLEAELRKIQENLSKLG